MNWKLKALFLLLAVCIAGVGLTTNNVKGPIDNNFWQPMYLSAAGSLVIFVFFQRAFVWFVSLTVTASAFRAAAFQIWDNRHAGFFLNLCLSIMTIIIWVNASKLRWNEK